MINSIKTTVVSVGSERRQNTKNWPGTLGFFAQAGSNLSSLNGTHS